MSITRAREQGARRTAIDHLRQLLIAGEVRPVSRLVGLPRVHGRRVVLGDALEEVRGELAEVGRARVGAGVLVDALHVCGPVHAGEGDDEAVVELAELLALAADDVRDLGAVLAGERHAHVARVAERGDAREELALRERLGEGEQRGAHRGGEVHLLRESYARVVFDDPDGLVHAPGEVERPPVEQV